MVTKTWRAEVLWLRTSPTDREFNGKVYELTIVILDYNQNDFMVRLLEERTIECGDAESGPKLDVELVEVTDFDLAFDLMTIRDLSMGRITIEQYLKNCLEYIDFMKKQGV